MDQYLVLVGAVLSDPSLSFLRVLSLSGISLFLSLFLSHLSLSLSFSLSVCLSVCLAVCLSVWEVCLSVWLSVWVCLLPSSSLALAGRPPLLWAHFLSNFFPSLVLGGERVIASSCDRLILNGCTTNSSNKLRERLCNVFCWVCSPAWAWDVAHWLMVSQRSWLWTFGPVSPIFLSRKSFWLLAIPHRGAGRL